MSMSVAQLEARAAALRADIYLTEQHCRAQNRPQRITEMATALVRAELAWTLRQWDIATA